MSLVRTLSLLILFSATAFSQTIQLSPEQQRMLDQLPPAQRQQALNAIRQIQNRQSSSQVPQTINEPLLTDIPSETVPLEFELEPRAEASSRLVVLFTPREDLSPSEKRALDEDTESQRLIGSHVFVLDDSGILTLQGIEQIPLLGLTKDDIERRLAATPYLSFFDVEANILSQEPIGIEALQPFGYDVFEASETGFDPPGAGPVPPDYVLGPGDTVRVQLFGNVNGIYEYEVSRDGILNLPELGPITVAGIRFSEFREDVNRRVEEMLIGTQVSVTMGQLRTIRVFVLGDVNAPGSYVVGGLATMSAALYRSGGVSQVGSLRNIQLKRRGRIVRTLDLYDLLIRGDTSDDLRLQPGDVIFVPPVGNTITVSGAVKRPAIYETRGKTSVSGAVSLAGGLTAEADGSGTRLERIDERKERVVLSVDLSNKDSAAMRVMAGDLLIVPEILPDLEKAVTLEGHVQRPGDYAWRQGTRLTDLIRSPSELKSGVDMNYVLIRRERERGKPIEVLSADLEAAFRGDRDENIVLLARDRVVVFSKDFGRQRVVESILEELERQATYDAPMQHVEIAGQVRAPGMYPLEDEMRISDLIRAGGGLTDDAYALSAELTRYSVNGGKQRLVRTVDINLDGILNGDSSSDVVVEPHDFVSITKVPEWDSIWTVMLEGEVRFPGTYRIQRGETLADVVNRAGGLTGDAFPEGAVFLRESLKETEQQQIEMLARRLEADLTTLSLQNVESSGTDTMTTGRALLDQLRNTEAVGRLVIDVAHLTSGSQPIELRDGDQLMIPTRTQVVSVIGETQQNASHLYQDGLSRDDYISLSGGLTRRADKRRIYIVRASGAVVARSGSRWLGRGKHADIRPGDTIVVPLDADKMRPLTFWTNVTQILYQGAIAVAAVRTFDN